MKTLIDTNILVYAHDSNSRFQKQSSSLLKRALAGKIDAVISIQNVSELYSVLTSARRISKPLAPTEASRICKLYLQAPELPKIVPNEKTVLRAVELASETNYTGGNYFDCLIAATMETYGVKRIYTENVEDFKSFPFLDPIFPME